MMDANQAVPVAARGPQAFRPTRALAIVDSRNVLYEVERVLGYQRRPTVDGVVQALAPYGFDVVAVHIGLALPRSSDRLDLAKFGAENGPYKDAIEKHPLGKALVGELHLKADQNVEEKQVDVACAVDIARYATLMARGESRFQAIVVVSQDSDLMPAYRFALDEMKIPLVVAAADVVHHRPEPFVLFTPPALAAIAEISEPLVGHELRAAVAEAVKERRQARWTCLGWDHRRKGFIVRTDVGVLGIVDRYDTPKGFDVDDTLELYANGVDFGQQLFPVVRCSPSKPSGPGDLRTGTVRKRHAAFSVDVDMANGTTERMYCPPGHVRRGTKVLVQQGKPCRLVGSLGAPPAGSTADADGIHAGTPEVVRVIGAISSTLSIGVRPGKGRIAITHSKAHAPELEGAYAVVVSDEPTPPHQKLPLGHLVSSRLPEPGTQKAAP